MRHRERRARRALSLAPALGALAAVALLLSGCETTAEKSAKLERAAKRQKIAQQQGLTISRTSRYVKVLGTAVVQGREGAAAVVTLRNDSPHALRHVPVSIAVKDSGGATVYSNGTPGLATTLTSIALLPAHAKLAWVDDQIQAKGAASVTARVGEGAAASGTVPDLTIAVQQLAAEGGGSTLEGAIHNGSSTAQPELVIYALARRGGRLVAAGRAVLASLDPGASTPFQVFFVGSAAGAKLEVSAPATASAG
ncbi:MAG TPA: hypothetical protein VL988_06650 [Solirubrobacteraceae bacterium]|nr:hypothetical protein [Solirubrobacteraceae bacterium]